ncbi:MAG: hypothetical protein KGI06_05835, partial [Candidatus Micrarchaeota archaeon]|nr:hypothetical protein [Candidatus Micrarchaeota archaeon]
QAAGNQPTNVQLYKLAFPYCIFIAHFRVPTTLLRACLFYRTKPLGVSMESSDVNGQHLYKAVLTNIYDNGQICLGDMVLTSTEPAGKTDELIAKFWSSEFTDELTESMDYADYPALKGYGNWQAATEENPLFVLEDVSWKWAGSAQDYQITG